MRLFITGVTGYIGRVVTEKALAEGHAVRGRRALRRRRREIEGSLVRLPCVEN